MTTTVAAAIAALVAAAPGVAADDPFAGVTETRSRCFARTYDTEHLATHPNQTVTAIAAKLSVNSFDNAGTWTEIPGVWIQARVRGDDRVFGVAMDCYEGGVCSLDCDGGAVRLRMSSQRPGSLLIFNEGNLTLEPVECGEAVSDEAREAMSLWLSSVKGGDDVFRLDPIDPLLCM